jgi:hypothetical protein
MSSADLERRNCYKTEIHNMALVNTGLLLLYRLADIESHDAKLSFIESLPQDPLVAIYLAITHAILTARFHGEGWMNQRTYGTFTSVSQLLFLVSMHEYRLHDIGGARRDANVTFAYLAGKFAC